MLKFNNKVILSPNGKWIDKEPDPYNPLNLPPNTIRVRCGRDTQTGAAELAQIPSDWK